MGKCQGTENDHVPGEKEEKNEKVLISLLLIFKTYLLFLRLYWVLAAALKTFDLHCGVQHVGSSFPLQGPNLGPMHWEHGVLATEL